VLTFAITGSDNVKEEASQVDTSEGSHGPSQPKSQAKSLKSTVSSGNKRQREAALELEGMDSS
jgi:hypothetical protein